MISFMVVVSLSQAPAAAPEVFVDRAETYVRIGFSQGLTKGATVEIVSADKRAHLGSAVVMEVWDSLARVNMDSAAASYKGPKIARLQGAAAPAADMRAPLVAADPPPPPPAAVPVGRAPVAARAVPAVPVAPANRRLTARVNLTHGAGDARRVMVSNDDGFDWHACRITLADGRTYDETEIKQHSDEGIMMFRFEPGNALRDPQGLVTLRCQEGDGRYVSGDP